MTTKKMVISFEIENENGEKVKLRVQRPTPRQLHNSQIEYNSAFAELVNRPKPALLREKLDDVMRDQGLWSDEKQARFEDLTKQLNDCELRLAKGGILLESGRDLALKMRRLRREIAALLAKRRQLDNCTAQGLADNHSFEYLVSECTLYDDSGKRYFASHDDYKEKSETEAAFKAAEHLAALLYGVDTDFEKKLPENQFLVKYGFVDEKLRLKNAEGHLVDEEGRLVDDEGRLVNAEGHLVDKEGNRVSPEGEYVVEAAPFLDATGNPVA